MIPDRVEAIVNFRYAPDRSPSSADAYLRSLVPEGATYEHAGDSPPARVVTDSPLVQRLRAAGDLALEPKQAWTNVADFTSRGIDAVNFGPGATRYAHRRDEQVEIAALERAFESLWALPHGYASERARLAHPRAPDDLSVRAPERGRTARRGARDRGDRLRHRRSRASPPTR